MSDIIIVNQPVSPVERLMPNHPSKDEKSRIGFYGLWLTQTGQHYIKPTLAAYRDYLMSNERTGIDPHTGEIKRLPALSEATTAAHLGTIKGRYKLLLTDDKFRDELFDLWTDHNKEFIARKSQVDEIIIRIYNAVHSKDSAVKQPTDQDKQHGTRLTKSQMEALIDAPFKVYADKPLRAIRDAAILMLMLFTGLREAELCALDVKDLREPDEKSGALCLRVKLGKGKKRRLIPYGEGIGALAYVDKWLNAAGITTGAVFRGLNTNNTQVVGERLVTRTINKIMDKYTEVKPHDLRRTYAKRLRDDQDFSLEIIKQNLGHSNVSTTERYVGDTDMSARAPIAPLCEINMDRLAAYG